MRTMFFNAVFGAMILMDKAGEGGGGGGAGGGEGKKEGEGGAGAGNVTLTKEQFDALMAKIDGKGANPPPKKEGEKPDENDDLATKTEKERKAKEEKAKGEKALEAAITFSAGAKEFLKNNASLLPKTVEQIFAQADKENYAGAIEKSNAIKVGLIKEFFNLQANLDLLTSTQKSALEDFNKLTNTGKQEQAQQIYDSIFEPALESLRRVKKAESLQKGMAQNDGNQDEYEKKMIELSRKHYLGETKNA